jgi:DNA-binding MarR family transcriptional regulator
MLSAKSIDFLTFSENKMPQFKELKSKGIVEFGEKNAFPEQLIYLLNKSATHNSIVQQKVLYIIGEGVKGVPEEKINQWNKYDTFQEFRYKITHDVKVFGGFAVEVVYNRAGVPSYYHIDVSKIRTLDHSQYFYAEDWSKAKAEDITSYPAYNPSVAKPMTKQLYYYREYRAGLDVYPLPEYYPALNYIDIDARISNFHQNNIASGFSAGHILQLFKGEPTPEEARLFKRKLKEYHQGDSNAGSVMLVYNEQNEPAAQLTPLVSSGLDTMFIELSKAVESNIFIAHQVVSPMLLGVKEEGQLGGRNELAVASELFYRQYVKPNQQRLDSIYTQFLNDMGIAAEVETLRFEPVEIDYVALFEKGIVDKNEVRQKLGLSVQAQFAEEEDREMQIFKFFGEEENYFEFADLTEKELKVIEVVNENPKASLKEISEVTKIAEEDIDKILQVLDQKGKIKYTSKAVKILDADILKQTLVVRYKYDLRADAPKLVAGGESRDFCKKLISLGRVYSREDIDKMSTVLGYDVWKRRGGWYHNPNTDVNEPACRHEWKQIIVRRKNA